VQGGPTALVLVPVQIREREGAGKEPHERQPVRQKNERLPEERFPERVEGNPPELEENQHDVPGPEDRKIMPVDRPTRPNKFADALRQIGDTEPDDDREKRDQGLKLGHTDRDDRT
jgi:hypothetical protein